jgi:DNA repair protein RecO
MIGMAIAELVNNTTHPNDKNEAIYNLLLNTLQSLNAAEKDFLCYLVYFQINYAGLIGYSPNFYSCASCGLEVTSGYKFDSIFFNFDGGSILCEECSNKIIVPLKKSSPGTSMIIRKFANIDADKVKSIRISPSLANEALLILHQYLKSHVTGMKDLKSLDLLFSITTE